jgi:hypothetical protein
MVLTRCCTLATNEDDWRGPEVILRSEKWVVVWAGCRSKLEEKVDRRRSRLLRPVAVLNTSDVVLSPDAKG